MKFYNPFDVVYKEQNVALALSVCLLTAVLLAAICITFMNYFGVASVVLITLVLAGARVLYAVFKGK